MGHGPVYIGTDIRGRVVGWLVEEIVCGYSQNSLFGREVRV